MNNNTKNVHTLSSSSNHIPKRVNKYCAFRRSVVFYITSQNMSTTIKCHKSAIYNSKTSRLLCIVYAYTIYLIKQLKRIFKVGQALYEHISCQCSLSKPPEKNQKNLRFSNVFRRYRKRTVGWTELKWASHFFLFMELLLNSLLNTSNQFHPTHMWLCLIISMLKQVEMFITTVTVNNSLWHSPALPSI